MTATASFHAVLSFEGQRLNAELVFGDEQLWELDPTTDELLFPSSGLDSFDLFLNRFAGNAEAFTLRFAGRERRFESLDALLQTLAEDGFELVSIAFDGFHFKDLEDYFGENSRTWSLSEERGITPEVIRTRRQYHSLIWA